MLSANADNMGLFRRMHDINITAVPLNPFDLITVNRWQVTTYQIFSQIIGMSTEEIEQQISPRAFAFYSPSYKTYHVVYNSETSPAKVHFNLAHEIGHIVHGHLSPSIPLMCFAGSNKPERDALADQFARFVLQFP